MIRFLKEKARSFAYSKHNEAVRKITVAHDMVSHPDESYYALQYLHWIRPECEARFPERNPAILDLGCGQGRLSLPLADWAKFGRVVGIDFTPQAIMKARRCAQDRGIPNVELMR